MTYRRVRTLPDGLPEHTLGWQILEWTADYLQQPDGPNAGEPWDFTDEQIRFVVWWYAIDRSGRFSYRYGMLRRMKGWGKDPLAAALACVEFVGPCRFGMWAEGEPVAVPHAAAWVQVAAVSKDQTRNTMTLFPGMFSRRAIEEYHIDLGKEIIYAHRGRCRLEAVTSSPETLEGGRATFIIKNETHHWTKSTGGDRMSEVIARNAAKSRDGSSRALAISNAHAPGQGSDAERDYEAYASGKAKDLLYDSVEAHGVDLGDETEVRDALAFCRGDSTWLDIDRLTAEIQDPRTAKNMSRRFYLNELAASDEVAFDIEAWRRAKARKVVPDGEVVTLGFDGSETRDHTVLVGTHVATGYQWIVGYWEPVERPDGSVRIPETEVHATVEDAFRRWNVWKLYADPSRWREALNVWAGMFNDGEDRIATWPTSMHRKYAYALAGYAMAIRSGALKHDGDARFEASIANAHKHELNIRDEETDEPLWLIAKERVDSPLKIDAAVAGCLSWQAGLDAIAAGALAVEEPAEVFFVG